MLLSCVAHKPNYFITPYVFPAPNLKFIFGLFDVNIRERNRVFLIVD